MVLKFSLLRLFHDHPAYPRFAGIEESISQLDIGYAQASRRILDAYLRAVSSQAGATALVAGAGAPAAGKKCWDCGAPGKIRGDGHACPTPNSGKFDTHDHRGGKGRRGGKAGGKGGPKGGQARGLAGPHVVEYPQVPPKSDPRLAQRTWRVSINSV